MFQVVLIERDALICRCSSMAARSGCRLSLRKGKQGRPRLVRTESCSDCQAACDSHAQVSHMFWPSPLAYRVAEFSMLGYPEDPGHHSAASDLVACRDRSIVLAGFTGDETTGTQAEWCDRMVGFMHLAVFVRTKRHGWFARKLLKQPPWRSFFAKEDVLTLLAGGDHFVSELAALADDHAQVEEAVDDLLEDRLKGRVVDVYVSDVVIPKTSLSNKEVLPPYKKLAIGLLTTRGVEGLAAILVPAQSPFKLDGQKRLRLKHRAGKMEMEKIATCPPRSEDEKKTPQEFWLSKRIRVRAAKRWYARTKVWLQEHSSAYAVLFLIAFLAGKFLDQALGFVVAEVGARFMP